MTLNFRWTLLCHGVDVVVYVFATKKSVKQYCRDTFEPGVEWLTFKEGFKRMDEFFDPDHT